MWSPLWVPKFYTKYCDVLSDRGDILEPFAQGAISGQLSTHQKWHVKNWLTIYSMASTALRLLSRTHWKEGKPDAEEAPRGRQQEQSQALCEVVAGWCAMTFPRRQWGKLNTTHAAINTVADLRCLKAPVQLWFPHFLITVQMTGGIIGDILPCQVTSMTAHSTKIPRSLSTQSCSTGCCQPLVSSLWSDKKFREGRVMLAHGLKRYSPIHCGRTGMGVWAVNSCNC